MKNLWHLFTALLIFFEMDSFSYPLSFCCENPTFLLKMKSLANALHQKNFVIKL